MGHSREKQHAQAARRCEKWKVRGVGRSPPRGCAGVKSKGTGTSCVDGSTAVADRLDGKVVGIIAGVVPCGDEIRKL